MLLSLVACLVAAWARRTRCLALTSSADITMAVNVLHHWLLAGQLQAPALREGLIQFMTSFALPLLGGLVLAGADIARHGQRRLQTRCH